LRILHLNYLTLLLPLFLFATPQENANDSFLSTVEYGKMLYKDPRGISCSKCHGKEGKGGKKIAKYYDKHKNIKLLKSIDITHYSLEDLTDSLNNQYRKDGRRKRHKIMPMYYLTDKEVFAIFTYLQSQIE